MSQKILTMGDAVRAEKQIAELQAELLDLRTGHDICDKENARLSEELRTQTAAMEDQGKVLRKAMDEIEELRRKAGEHNERLQELLQALPLPVRMYYRSKYWFDDDGKVK